MDSNKLMPKTKLAKVQELIQLKTDHHNMMQKEKFEQKIVSLNHLILPKSKQYMEVTKGFLCR